MSLTTAELYTVVTVTARDTEDGKVHRGSFRVVTKDIGATIGVGLHLGEELVHAFYAHTRYAGRAEEITRDLIYDTVDEIRCDRGARQVFEYFAERFRAVARKRGFEPLDPDELHD